MLILQLVSLDNDQIALVQSFGEKEAFSHSVSNDDFWHGAPNVQYNFVSEDTSQQNLFEQSQLFFTYNFQLPVSYLKEQVFNFCISASISDYIYALIFPFHGHW